MFLSSDFRFDLGVVDAKQLARHFTQDELAQLYQFDFDRDDDSIDECDIRRVKDGILRHLIKNHPDTIVSYREHDSFLIHRDEENLTIEEQIQARDEGSLIFFYLNISYRRNSFFFSR